MSLILCLETSTEVCSVALAQNGTPIGLLQIAQGNAHASGLHVLVKELFDKCSLNLNQLDAVAVSKGPGSYTGLRVGVSAAKGYCYTLEIPLIAIDSLKSLAYHFLIHHQPNDNSLLVPMIDARRMEVYTSVFDQHLKTIEPIGAKIITPDSYQELLRRSELLFFGNGSQKCKNSINHKNAVFIDETRCSADGLCELAATKFLEKDFEDLAYFEPFYLKDFVGTRPKSS